MQLNTHTIFGGPGAGKTERLMKILESELEAGVDPDRIAFVSFTTKAVNEGTIRAMIKFGFAEDELPWFRSLHSMCFRRLGLSMHQDTMDSEDYRELGAALGVRITGIMINDADSLDGIPKGDRMVAIDRLARETFTSLEEVWRQEAEGLCSWYEQKRFSESLKAFKHDRGGICDWSDTLLRFVEEGTPLDVDVAVIDEAQDLNPVQWEVIERAFGGAYRTYFAGDDDQAIYTWMGADVKKFLQLGESGTVETLPRSYRLPANIFVFVEELARRITGRYVKYWGANGDGGEVIRIPFLDGIDLTGEGSWYLLARNRCFLSTFEEECMRQGVLFTKRKGRNTTYPSVEPDHLKGIRAYEKARKGNSITGSQARLVARYLQIKRKTFDAKRMYKLNDIVDIPESWIPEAKIWNLALIGIPAHLRSYYTTIRRKGRRLDAQAHIHIDTIHGVKGGEADHVVLACDMTARTEKTMERDPASEARVFYVGASRARKRLFLLRPQTGRFFIL